MPERPSNVGPVETRTIPTEVDYPTEESTESELAEEVPEPVATEIVGVVETREDQDKRVTWGTERWSLSTMEAKPILRRDLYRKSVLLLNAGPDTVYILSSESNIVADGFPIALNASLELTATEAVWAMVDSGDSAVLHMVWERTLYDEN